MIVDILKLGGMLIGIAVIVWLLWAFTSGDDMDAGGHY